MHFKTKLTALSRKLSGSPLKSSNNTSNGIAKKDEEQHQAKINKRLKRKRKFMAGDLSCMKAAFVPAPRITNANIKYIRWADARVWSRLFLQFPLIIFVIIARNEVLGIEKSFLEAEYHCSDGYKLKKHSKRKTFIKNENLICKNRRWIGQRPSCKEIKPKLMLQQCDIHESKICEQLCIKREDSAEAICRCHRGFRLIGSRCFGKINTRKKWTLLKHDCL